MTRGLVEESGKFRSRPVGVVDQAGRIVHFGTLPQYVPGLVSELLTWTKNSDLHMLIRSCVFHYEFELIHPFTDGIGRLWHTLLFSKVVLHNRRLCIHGKSKFNWWYNSRISVALEP